MVTGIALTGMYHIGVSANNKMQTPDGITIELKDVPFVRYRFDKYGEEEISFILNNKKTFKCANIVEITLSPDTQDILDKIAELDPDIASLVYVDVTDAEVKGGFNQETLDLISGLDQSSYDYLNIRDKSTTLNAFSISRLIEDVRYALGDVRAEIGVCGGTCCFQDQNACLTARKTREIMARCSTPDELKLPSANHEISVETVDTLESCINKCGCVRYHIYTHDVAAPATKSRGGATKTIKVTTEDGEKQVKAKATEKQKKPAKLKGYVPLDW